MSWFFYILLFGVMYLAYAILRGIQQSMSDFVQSRKKCDRDSDSD
jgi:hypothetical protein